MSRADDEKRASTAAVPVEYEDNEPVVTKKRPASLLEVDFKLLRAAFQAQGSQLGVLSQQVERVEAQQAEHDRQTAIMIGRFEILESSVVDLGVRVAALEASVASVHTKLDAVTAMLKMIVPRLSME